MCLCGQLLAEKLIDARRRAVRHSIALGHTAHGGTGGTPPGGRKGRSHSIAPAPTASAHGSPLGRSNPGSPISVEVVLLDIWHCLAKEGMTVTHLVQKQLSRLGLTSFF